jgi:long-chain acyl-CoA synthetase
MNILLALHRAARLHPAAVAVRCATAELTYPDVVEQAARFASYLTGQGIRPGQRVGIFMHNQPEWVVALLGIWHAGAVAVPFNFLFSPTALRHAAVDSATQLVVAPSADLPRLLDALAGLPVTERVVAVAGRGDAAPETATAFGSALEYPPAGPVAPRRDGDDAIIMYTAGSTGTPKGVRQTHRNTSAVCEAIIDWWSLSGNDHALVCTPLFHVGGLQLIALPVLMAGGTVTLRRWQVAEYLDDAVALRPTVTALVPAMMIDILNFLDGRRLPLDSLRVCEIGGSALPQSRLRAFTQATGIVPVNVYGQTEQSGLAVTEPVELPRRVGSMGRALEQITEVTVVPVGRTEPLPLGCDEVGELWVRGDAVTPGYVNLDDVNAAKFTADGWFRTSDLVRSDADGFLYYVDRADEMIISGGENVFPQMVEGHLAACPLIAEVAVIGTPHQRLGQQVTALVVPTRQDVTAEDIAAYCRTDGNLRGLQRPQRIEVVEAIARTATNKIDRPTLKATYG